jgi:hypothetical protein
MAFSPRVKRHLGNALRPNRGHFAFYADRVRKVVSATVLLGHSEPKPSYPGIAILIAAIVIMPLLAKQKRKLSATTGSAALRADAAQSSVCAYLSAIALVGLAMNAIFEGSLASAADPANPRSSRLLGSWPETGFGEVGQIGNGKSASRHQSHT